MLLLQASRLAVPWRLGQISFSWIPSFQAVRFPAGASVTLCSSDRTMQLCYIDALRFVRGAHSKRHSKVFYYLLLVSALCLPPIAYGRHSKSG